LWFLCTENPRWLATTVAAVRNGCAAERLSDGSFPSVPGLSPSSSGLWFVAPTFSQRLFSFAPLASFHRGSIRGQPTRLDQPGGWGGTKSLLPTLRVSLQTHTPPVPPPPFCFVVMFLPQTNGSGKTELCVSLCKSVSPSSRNPLIPPMPPSSVFSSQWRCWLAMALDTFPKPTARTADILLYPLTPLLHPRLPSLLSRSGHWGGTCPPWILPVRAPSGYLKILKIRI